MQDINIKDLQEKGKVGNYNPKNPRRISPLTLIYNWEDFNFNDYVSNLKLIINVNDNFKNILENISSNVNYSNANSSKNNENKHKTNRTNANFAKSNAFIAYLNFKYDGTAIIDLTSNGRWEYINRAKQALYDIEVNQNLGTGEDLQYHNHALICALQSYDLLKAIGWVSQDTLNTIKYCLQRYARNIHKNASSVNGAYSAFRTNNHTLMAAGATWTCSSCII